MPLSSSEGKANSVPCLQPKDVPLGSRCGWKVKKPPVRNQVLTCTRAPKARAETQNMDNWKLGRGDKKMQNHPVRRHHISPRGFRPQSFGKGLQRNCFLTTSILRAGGPCQAHLAPSPSIHPSSLSLSPLPIQTPEGPGWLGASPERSPQSRVKCLSTISKVLSLGARQRTNKVLVVGGVKNS